MKLLIDYAMKFIGIHYKYGGNHPAEGLDCSGFVQIILRAAGIASKGDLSAQMLYDNYLLNGSRSEPQAGALCFYGKSAEYISHVSFMISPDLVIEAGGGDATTLDIQKAIAKQAFVRIRPYDHRKDLVAIRIPKYPDWVGA